MLVLPDDDIIADAVVLNSVSSCDAWSPNTIIDFCSSTLRTASRNIELFVNDCEESSSSLRGFPGGDMFGEGIEMMCERGIEKIRNQRIEEVVHVVGVNALMPRLIGIGASHTGTSITFSGLRQLPQVYTAAGGNTAEVQHFNRDSEYERGIFWYATRFVSQITAAGGPGIELKEPTGNEQFVRHILNSDFVEKSPQYGGHPLVPFRI